MSEGTGEPVLLVEVRDRVGILTFNRPGKLNALSSAMRRGFVAALADFALRDEVRAVVVTGKGRAFTAGLDLDEIALALDMLVVGESAAFIDTHVRVGIVPGWGLSQRLSRAVGLARANELSLSCRPLGAAEAVVWGLANRMVPDADLMTSALELAGSIVVHDPVGVARMKCLIAAGYAGTLHDGLVMEDAAARRLNRQIGSAGVPGRETKAE